MHYNAWLIISVESEKVEQHEWASADDNVTTFWRDGITERIYQVINSGQTPRNYDALNPGIAQGTLLVQSTAAQDAEQPHQRRQRNEQTIKMVYESDFYTTRRPYRTSPSLSTYTVSVSPTINHCLSKKFDGTIFRKKIEIIAES